MDYNLIAQVIDSDWWSVYFASDCSFEGTEFVTIGMSLSMI